MSNHAARLKQWQFVVGSFDPVQTLLLAEAAASPQAAFTAIATAVGLPASNLDENDRSTLFGVIAQRLIDLRTLAVLNNALAPSLGPGQNYYNWVY